MKLLVCVLIAAVGSASAGRRETRSVVGQHGGLAPGYAGAHVPHVAALPAAAVSSYPSGVVSGGHYYAAGAPLLTPGLVGVGGAFAGHGLLQGGGSSGHVVSSTGDGGYVTVHDDAIPVRTVEHRRPVAVPQPYPVPVETRVPVEVPVPVHVPVDRPVPVPVPRPYNVYVDRPVPYTVEKRVPYPVRVAVQVPVQVPVPYDVPQPYPVAVEVPQPVPVHAAPCHSRPAF